MYEGKLQESHFLPVLLTVLQLLAVLLMGIPAVSVQAAGVKNTRQSEYYQCENDWKQQGNH